MKLNIIFGVFTLFFVFQVQSEIISFLKSHNPITEVANAKLDEAVNLLKQKVYEQNKAIELGEELQQGANGITNKVYASVKKTLQFLENEIAKATKEADIQGIDVSKCRKMTNSLHHAVFVMVTNSSKCINEKLTEGKTLVDNILQRTQIAITELTKITSEANQCFKNVNGIKVINGFGCLTVSGVKASWAVAKHAPSVALNLKRFTSLISNLHGSLVFCINKKAVLTLAEESATILESIKRCVSEKIKGFPNGKKKSPIMTALQLYNPNDKIQYEKKQALEKAKAQAQEKENEKEKEKEMFEALSQFPAEVQEKNSDVK